MMRAKTRHLLAFCHFMNITCHGYLRGYIEAHPEIAFNEDMPSGFMQRVLRTRSPAHPSTDAAKLAVYCLEGDQSMVEISATIAAMEPQAVASKSPASVIDNILKHRYRCRS